jgi:peptidoglycan/LPS O-acetylase OafA/YrhL
MPLNLKPLTAMRFFAAMWVVAYHFTPSLSRAMPLLIAKGYLGVELFFVLSGFILSHVYMQAFGDGAGHYREFLWARLARIYPVHLATLVGLGLLATAAAALRLNAGDQVTTWSSIAAQLTLTQAWGLGQAGGWNHPSWSISAEWFAYLSFPLFAAVIWPLRNRPKLAVLLAGALVIGLDFGFEALAGFPLTRATTVWGALRIVPCFALGCAVWLLWRTEVVKTARRAVFGTFASVVAIAGCALLSAPDWLMVCTFGLLILCLGSLASTGSKLLTAPLWVYLGEVSFAVYMVCIPWQLVFEHIVRKVWQIPGTTLPPALWAVLYVGVIPAAIVLHHLVERPAREVMRRSGAPFIKRRAAAEPSFLRGAVAGQ